jgi:hypothetical protein
MYDEEGNLLEENPLDANEAERRRKMAVVRNKVESIIQQAKSSKEGMDFLVSSMTNIEASLSQIIPCSVQSRQQEYEGFIGCQIPDEVHIHPPTNVRSKGRSKRIKNSKNYLRQENERMTVKNHMFCRCMIYVISVQMHEHGYFVTFLVSTCMEHLHNNYKLLVEIPNSIFVLILDSTLCVWDYEVQCCTEGG